MITLNSKKASAYVFGRIFIYEDETTEVETWVHELDKTEPGRRTSSDWARNHFCECYSSHDLRKLFELPAEGNFQVLFKGTLRGFSCGPWEAPDSEWDEEFDIDEKQIAPIPQEWIDLKVKLEEERIAFEKIVAEERGNV